MKSLDLFQRLAVSLLPLVLALTVREIARGYMAHSLGDNTARAEGRLSLNPLAHVDPIGTLLLPGVFIALSSAGISSFLIGWPKFIPISEGRFRDPRSGAIKVAAAGLLANLAMAIAFAVLLKIANGMPGSSEGVWLGVRYMANVGIAFNVNFFVLNLLPLPPFDVGRMLLVTLPPRQAMKLEQIQPYTFPIILVLAFIGVLGAITAPIYKLTLGLIQLIV
ncbi:site-2 protease family protein [Nevskia sp.]|uniref:site-2 protease family protein n=1 Tax=Nevskia sp. TaxID=1929292 RepID=UPI0025FD159C|nr:site-2 protease family protein [Nevskia sp.]